jgi:hypothetical protein
MQRHQQFTPSNRQPTAHGIWCSPALPRTNKLLHVGWGLRSCASAPKVTTRWQYRLCRRRRRRRRASWRSTSACCCTRSSPIPSDPTSRRTPSAQIACAPFSTAFRPPASSPCVHPERSTPEGSRGLRWPLSLVGYIWLRVSQTEAGGWLIRDRATCPLAATSTAAHDSSGYRFSRSRADAGRALIVHCGFSWTVPQPA